jgi:PAS domain S-box-containing protein
MSRALGSASPKLRLAAATAAFAILYFLAAALTGSLIGDPGIAVLWPASGVYLGVMLVAPRRMWPALACAAAVGSLAAYLQAGSSLEVSIAFAVPSSAEGLLGALLVERIAGGRLTLGGLKDLIALMVGGAVVAIALVALSAGAIAAQTFGASFADSWLRWWSADALGVIAVAPLIVAPLRGWRRRPTRAELRRAGWVLAGIGFAVGFAAWSEPAGVATLVGGAIALPFVLYAGWRWGMRAAALGGLGPALVATHVASEGLGLGAYTGSAGGQVYLVQAFLAVLLLGSLAFAASVGDQRREQAAAAKGRGRLRRVVDSMPDAYLAVDADGAITAWSASAEAMFGWDAGYAVGRPLAETIASGEGTDASALERMLGENSDAPARELELAARTRDGRRFPVKLTVQAASDDELCHVFIRDATESERLREELDRAKAELERGRSTLSRKEQELKRLGRELALATAGRDQVRRDLDESARDLGRVQDELRDAVGELARATARSRALEDAVETARAEQARTTTRNRALEDALEKARAEQARTAEERDGAMAERRNAEQELEEASARFAEERERVEQEARAQIAEERERLEQEARAQIAQERERVEQEARAQLAQERERVEEAARGQFAQERDRLEQEVVARFAEERERAEQEARAELARECERFEQEARERFAEERERLDQESRAELAGERERLEQEARAWFDEGRHHLEQEARVQLAEERERVEQEVRARFAEERERLEQSLEQAAKSQARAEAERRLLGDHASELIASYDQRGACLYASPASRRLLGYEPEELVGRPGADLLHPDDRHRLARARATRTASSFEARLRRKSGDFVWVDVTLVPIFDRGERLVAMNTTVRDISERRAFDSLFGTMPTGSALLGRDGRVERANPALCRLTGYSRERLEGTTLAAIVHREDGVSFSTDLRRLAAGEVASLRLGQQLVHASGRTVPVELSVTPLAAGDVFVAHIQDLTEGTRARDEVRRFSPGQTPPRQTAA